MHQNADLAGRHVEQPASLDHLKAFIHQGCRIDSDALAHLPGRMVERLLDGDLGELAGGSVQKRATRSGQPNPLHFVAATAAHSLVNRIVFAVDGQQRLALSAGLGRDQVAGGDQTFLVGQADRLAGLDRFVSGLESGDTDDGADHKIGVGMSRDPDRSSRPVHHFDRASQSSLVQFVLNLAGGVGGRHRQDLRTPAPRLLEGELDVVARCHGDHGEPVGKALDNVERALADGTRGAEDGDSLHEVISVSQLSSRSF